MTRGRILKLMALAAGGISAAVMLRGAATGGRLVRHLNRAAARSRPVSIPPQQAAGPWFVVSPETNEALGDGLIYHQLCGKGAPPEFLTRTKLELPDSHPLHRFGGVIIAETVIATDGKIARARILKGPTKPLVEKAARECLMSWRFRPARLNGEPVNVYYCLTLAVRPHGGRAPTEP